MKILLVGYPGSQCIVPASKYLTAKYLPGFDITYLNYTGDIRGWSTYLQDYLSTLPDKYVIFSLDDYLIAGPIEFGKYQLAVDEMGWTRWTEGNKGKVICVKLCRSTDEEHHEYPVTTQYCIWERLDLIWLLRHVSTPWEFEIEGSKIARKYHRLALHRPCIDYFTNSSISNRWPGKVNLTGLGTEDLKAAWELLPKKHPVMITAMEEIETMTGEQVFQIYEDTGVMLKRMPPPEHRTVVFGGSGFLGHALVKVLVAAGRNVTVVARNEGNLVALKEKFPTIQIMVGDIADPWIVKKAMTNADEIFLLSAMKHVGLAEVDVKSCIQTNIVGTMNVINESLVTKPKVLLFVSSDKAAQGTGIYGMSKKVGEKLMVEASQINTGTKYRVVRYGNILYSTGSVLCKWREKMQNGQEVIVTDENATRFFWPIAEAVDLIFTCIASAKDASPFAAGMKSIRIGDLLEAMMEKYGKVPVKTIGLQPGENRHEIITADLPDSFSSERFTKEEILQLV